MVGRSIRVMSSAMLLAHPAVADAGVAGFATPRATWSECAFVVPMPGSSVAEAELLEFVGTRLSPHEVPSSITLLDRLPRSSVGKLLRADLEALAAQEGGVRPTRGNR